MQRFLLLAPLLLGAAACQSAPDAASAPAPASAQPRPVPVQTEHIELAMLTINGKPHQELTTRQLTGQLGRPDSVAKGAVECGGALASLNQLDGAGGDFWYYGKTTYEVSGTQAILASFDVTTGKFRGQLGQLVLNQHTTLEDVRRFFPRAARQADVPATGRPGEVLSLPFYYDGKPMDDTLELIFKKGRLQEVAFFSPC